MKLCRVCRCQHEGETKTCQSCLDEKRQLNKDYYNNPEAVKKRREIVKVWKQSHLEMIKEQRRRYRQNRKLRERAKKSNEFQTDLV